MGSTLESSHISIRSDAEVVLRLIEFHGLLGGRPPVVFDHRHNTVLQSLQFLCSYLGFKFLGQGASTLPKLTGIFLSHSQPVVGRATVLFGCALACSEAPTVRKRRVLITGLV
jgi:hypothetical protein